MTRLSIRIDFVLPQDSLGPGKVRLLEDIARLGSIRKAAAAVNMSYRKAWLLLQAMQKTFGGPVVDTMTGGAAGGGARLTKLGVLLLAHYRSIEASAAGAAASDLEVLAALVKIAPVAGSAPRKRRGSRPA